MSGRVISFRGPKSKPGQTASELFGRALDELRAERARNGQRPSSALGHRTPGLVIDFAGERARNRSRGEYSKGDVELPPFEICAPCPHLANCKGLETPGCPAGDDRPTE